MGNKIKANGYKKYESAWMSLMALFSSFDCAKIPTIFFSCSPTTPPLHTDEIPSNENV